MATILQRRAGKFRYVTRTGGGLSLRRDENTMERACESTENTLSSALPQMRCAACGALEPADRLFCSRCTAPLAVVPLHDLAPSDLLTCLGALLKTLGDSLGEPGATSCEDPELWRAYLSAQWLRPETALILYAEALAVRRLADPRRAPWLDLGCGDGVHAAIQHDWRFDSLFDCFQCLNPGAPDIYNHWDAGAFDVHATRRGTPIACGVDIKPTAVHRSAALGVFDRVLQADATALPLEDATFRVIFSNMLRDLGEPLAPALDECRRVLSPDGLLLISTMTPEYVDSLYFAPAAREAARRGEPDRAKLMLRLDRGRSVFCRRQLSTDQWDALLREHGLGIASVQPVIGPQAIRFWDTGLRPFSTALLAQRASWHAKGVLPEVKPPICSMLDWIMRPLASARLQGGPPCMNILAVRKA